MSRRPTRTAKARRVRRPPADAAIVERRAASTREPTLSRARSVKPASASEDRIWRALLVGGAAVAFGLLGRQISDLYVDRKRPTFFQNDIYSALGTLAMLAIIGVFAWNRARMARLGGPR